MNATIVVIVYGVNPPAMSSAPNTVWYYEVTGSFSIIYLFFTQNFEIGSAL